MVVSEVFEGVDRGVVWLGGLGVVLVFGLVLGFELLVVGNKAIGFGGLFFRLVSVLLFDLCEGVFVVVGGRLRGFMMLRFDASEQIVEVI